jgi:hypothetical protein
MAEPVIYRPGLKINFRRLSPERAENGQLSHVAFTDTVGAACGIGTVKPAYRRLAPNGIPGSRTPERPIACMRPG